MWKPRVKHLKPYIQDYLQRRGKIYRLTKMRQRSTEDVGALNVSKTKTEESCWKTVKSLGDGCDFNEILVNKEYPRKLLSEVCSSNSLTRPISGRESEC